MRPIWEVSISDLSPEIGNHKNFYTFHYIQEPKHVMTENTLYLIKLVRLNNHPLTRNLNIWYSVVIIDV
jgi:hypothetical protein